ncbi:MAG: pseudouridine synthase [Candidatus Cyclobacteriaceae bacterium M2_1C_046]
MSKKKSVKNTNEPEPIRLNKYIAQAGVCSRREADKLISDGLVTVNGQKITEMGYKVMPSDDVQFKGKRLRPEKHVYILLNKPKDFLTTTDDPHERKTVMDLIKNATDQRVYPVGRLDRSTTGLLLFTNDGDLAVKLTHPSNEVSKIYSVELDKKIIKEDLGKLTEGVELEEGIAKADDAALLAEDPKQVGLEIHIGWNHVVRRMFSTLGYDVVKLDRVMFAGLDKRDLPRGKWRHLTNKEVITLKHLRGAKAKKKKK